MRTILIYSVRQFNYSQNAEIQGNILRFQGTLVLNGADFNFTTPKTGGIVSSYINLGGFGTHARRLPCTRCELGTLISSAVGTIFSIHSVMTFP